MRRAVLPPVPQVRRRSDIAEWSGSVESEDRGTVKLSVTLSLREAVPDEVQFPGIADRVESVRLVSRLLEEGALVLTDTVLHEFADPERIDSDLHVTIPATAAMMLTVELRFTDAARVELVDGAEPLMGEPILIWHARPNSAGRGRIVYRSDSATPPMSVEFVERDEYAFTTAIGAFENDLGHSVSFDLSAERIADTERVR